MAKNEIMQCRVPRFLTQLSHFLGKPPGPQLFYPCALLVYAQQPGGETETLQLHLTEIHRFETFFIQTIHTCIQLHKGRHLCVSPKVFVDFVNPSRVRWTGGEVKFQGAKCFSWTFWSNTPEVEQQVETPEKMVGSWSRRVTGSLLGWFGNFSGVNG